MKKKTGYGKKIYRQKKTGYGKKCKQQIVLLASVFGKRHRERGI